MTELDRLIATAFDSEGKQEDANKVYLTFLNTTLFLPVNPEKKPNDEEPFRPLFTEVDNHYFMLVFDALEKLKVWAGDQMHQIGYVEISGADIVAGLNENVYLCLNYATEFYKEFSPDEVKKLKMIVAKIAQLKNE